MSAIKVAEGEVAKGEVAEGEVTSDSTDVETLAGLVAARAAASPHDTALIEPLDAGEERPGRLSWSDVDARVGAMADALRGVGVVKGDRVLVFAHKSTATFVAVHAVLRCGAVMVPIDPLGPAEGAERVVRSTQPRAAVVDGHTRVRLASLLPADVAVIDVDDVPSGLPGRRSRDLLADAPPDPGDPAYIIFTSGSTGEPKGMVHSHRSGLAYARLAAHTHDIRSDDRIAGMSPLHFDMSTLELYVAPLVGAAVVPVPDTHLRMPAEFTELCERHRFTILYSVPFQFRQIEGRGAMDQRDLSSIRHVIYAGEPFPPKALRALMDRLPNARFSNAYGPAETNVCTVYELAGDWQPDHDVPLGWPWGGAEVRVVDPNGQVVASGDDGELWVRCETLMDGYWQRPDLTGERFVHDDESPTPWYRTGDLVRMDGAGCLWFRGRIDHQVKIRGVRLELEAIESVLSDAPGVLHAVVGPHTHLGGAPELRAAVVLESEENELDVRAIRRWCGQRLSPAAVPQSVVAHASFPLTASGKIDRRRIREGLASSSAVIGAES